MIYSKVNDCIKAFQEGAEVAIYNGDCRDLLAGLNDNSIDLTVSSPPYFVGKSYDTSTNIEDFKKLHADIAADIYRITKSEGNLCWQIGNHISSEKLTPLEYIVYPIFSLEQKFILRNRIIWTFGHGTHAKKRLSGRHEVILSFAKTDKSYFDLDSIRVAQKYPGKRYYKGPKRGEWSANPLGKNPGDVWDIPNVKANHIEKTSHPCQFPAALSQKCIRAFCRPDGIVFDPFLGAGTVAIASLIEGRRFIGSEMNTEYCEIAMRRILQFKSGNLRHRPLDKPVYVPDPRTTVARNPFQV